MLPGDDFWTDKKEQNVELGSESKQIRCVSTLASGAEILRWKVAVYSHSVQRLVRRIETEIGGSDKAVCTGPQSAVI